MSSSAPETVRGESPPPNSRWRPCAGSAAMRRIPASSATRRSTSGPARLRNELGVPLVLDGPPGANFAADEGAVPHYSSLPGLIYATRRAAAIVGVDSGPLHLAAALGKPGVAIFGPTDPARNGPHSDSLRVLRTPAAATTYKRGKAVDPSMRSITR